MPVDACHALDAVLDEGGLHLVPQRLVDDRIVLAGIGVILVDDLAAIDAVLQHQIERAAGDRHAARCIAEAVEPGLADDAGRVEFLLECTNRFQLGIAAEDMADGVGLGLLTTSLRSSTS